VRGGLLGTLLVGGAVGSSSSEGHQIVLFKPLFVLGGFTGVHVEEDEEGHTDEEVQGVESDEHVAFLAFEDIPRPALAIPRFLCFVVVHHEDLVAQIHNQNSYHVKDDEDDCDN
jgi:hypothetical protein